MQLVRQSLHVKSARIENLYSQSYFSLARVWIKIHTVYPHIFTLDPGSGTLKNYTDFAKSGGSGWAGPGCRSGSGDMTPVRIHNTVQV
jgi:hypothetical protein